LEDREKTEENRTIFDSAALSKRPCKAATSLR
jgi:hypothetical protein